jgi:pimeloyl-ACP methyl ester carboxylesterase
MNSLAIRDGRKEKTMKFKAGLDGVTFTSNGQEVLGGFYNAEKEAPRPTAVLLHGLPGIEKHLDIAYELRDRGWNCMYFQFRGCWGSQGTFSLAGLTGDTRGAVEWVRKQPSVGGSTGMYPALLHAAADPGIRAVVGISPLIEPRAFQFPTAVADNFAGMLNGVTGQELQEQWKLLPPLSDSVGALAPRPLLLVTAEKDDIFPGRSTRIQSVGLPISNTYQTKRAITDSAPAACGWSEP